MIKYYIGAILTIILLIYCVLTFSTGTVYYVVDGDTFWIGNHKMNYSKIRILEIDTPELGEKMGFEAKDYLTQLIDDKFVTMRCTHKDIYNRNLCYVYINGRSVGQMMIDAGYSKFIKPY